MDKPESRDVVNVKSVHKSFAVPHTRKYTIKSTFTGLFERKNTKPKTTRQALRDINFEVKQGEFFGIVGRNGSGKSTLLKMIAGIYEPSKGKITVNGRLVPFIELGVGFNPELTGKQNVYLNGAILGFSQHEIDSRYDQIVEFAELEAFMDEKLKNYSSGMQVRLAFSCATMAQADVLLVDEVLAVGDADFQRKCFNYFKMLKREKKTVIFVSHDMNAIREYCDRAILIEDGVILVSGKARDVASRYTRLFTDDDKSEEEVKKTGKRWGDGMAKTLGVTSDADVYRAGDTIVISQTIEAYSDVESPVPGFMVKNAAGTPILGTNTRIKKLDIPDMSKGAKITIKWQLENVFADGQYFIDPAVNHGSSGTRTADWWEEAHSFTVRKEEQVPYPVNPDISVRYEKGTNSK